MTFQPPKGTDDIVPPASGTWRGLLRAFEDLSDQYGYELIITPVFEATDLFERGVGEGTDVVQKQMYSFTDRGGRSLTLRPENTAGVVRAYLASGVQGSWKVAYSGPMFRYERPQGGRRRQFWQVGVEYLGVESPLADVEVIDLGHRFLEKAGASSKLVINTLGDARCRPRYIERLRTYLESKADQLCDDSRARISSNPLRVLDCKVCAPALADAPSIVDDLCTACARHYRALKAGLDRLGISYREDPRLVRGLDYYVRTAFEFISTTLRSAQNALLSGGRYDGLSETIGGRPAPGVGWAAGVDRIVLAVGGSPLPAVDVFVVTEADVQPEAALELVAALRREGIRTDFDPEGRSVKAQFRAADRAGAATVVVVGPDGAEVRHNGQRTRLAVDEVSAWLRR